MAIYISTPILSTRSLEPRICSVFEYKDTRYLHEVWGAELGPAPGRGWGQRDPGAPFTHQLWVRAPLFHTSPPAPFQENGTAAGGRGSHRSPHGALAPRVYFCGHPACISANSKTHPPDLGKTQPFSHQVARPETVFCLHNGMSTPRYIFYVILAPQLVELPLWASVNQIRKLLKCSHIERSG